MRVFCAEHQKSFFAPRLSPIKCENRGHVLGELNFDGDADSSSVFQWQYCCNCEHFCLINFADHVLERCPVCTRRSSVRYLCASCYTMSFESNTPLQTKNFTLSSEGIPEPCCPGCLQSAPADLHEHTCDEAHVSYVTGLNACPICGERLDVGPSFPSSVAQYLKRTRSANKLNVTFDYETGLFVQVDDGEFVLITIEDDTKKTIVIPRSVALSTQRDFYELYQDYYYCAAPTKGEINISDPAVVVPTPDGWKLLARGIFEVVANEPKKRSPITVTPERLELPVRKEPQTSPLESDQLLACPNCETLIEAKYAFCWKCGYRRAAKNDMSKSKHLLESEPPDYDEHFEAELAEFEDDEAQTVQHERPPRSSSSLLFASVARPDPSLRVTRSVLKLFGIAAAGVLLIALTLFFILRPSAKLASGPVPSNAPATTNTMPAANTEVARNAEIKPAALRVPGQSNEDTALERVRQLQDAGDVSNHSKILKTLSESEMKYKDDYRFPYERARVVTVDHDRNFHEEAFAALARAAQKAISKGKAGEMLDSLNKDSGGDFQRLSHGHPEWKQLQEALKRNDARVLAVNEGL